MIVAGRLHTTDWFLSFNGVACRQGFLEDKSHVVVPFNPWGESSNQVIVRLKYIFWIQDLNKSIGCWLYVTPGEIFSNKAKKVWETQERRFYITEGYKLDQIFCSHYLWLKIILARRRRSEAMIILAERCCFSTSCASIAWSWKSELL